MGASYSVQVVHMLVQCVLLLAVAFGQVCSTRLSAGRCQNLQEHLACKGCTCMQMSHVFFSHADPEWGLYVILWLIVKGCCC